jgi:hypothetical protein
MDSRRYEAKALLNGVSACKKVLIKQMKECHVYKWVEAVGVVKGRPSRP